MSFEEHLIELVREKPILYDLKNKNYKRSDIKDKIWREIANKLKSTDHLCKVKWKSLRDTYRRARRQTPTSGSAALEPTDEGQVKKWKYYELMSFLSNIEDQRSTIGNYENISNSSECLNDVLEDNSGGFTDFDETTSGLCSTPTKKRKLSASSSKSDVHDNFKNFLDVAAKSVSQLDVPAKSVTSTSLLFSSLALKIENSNLPKAALDELEQDISNLVYQRLRENYNATQFP